MVPNCTVYYASHPGSREENQDNYLIPGMRIKKLRQDSLYSGEKKCYLSPGKTVEVAVSDGMGGEENGAFASKAVLKALKKYSGSAIRTNIINEVILKAQNQYGNCGATLVCADFRSDGSSVIAYIEAAGDSPCFLIRNGKAIKITRDDNLYQRYREENSLPSDIEEIARAKAALLEYFGKPIVTTQLYRMFVEPGDVFILSSDGVKLEEGDYPFFMEKGVNNPAEELVSVSVRENLELTEGSSDNTTAVIVEFV